MVIPSRLRLVLVVAARQWKGKKASPIDDVRPVFDVESHRARLARVKGITHRTQPLLGVIAASRFTKEAHHAARSAGLMVINLKDVFGDAALDDSGGRSSQVANGDEDQFADVENITITLGHPFVTDLRSLGLETLSALIARVDGWEDVKVGISVPFKKARSRCIGPHSWRTPCSRR